MLKQISISGWLFTTLSYPTHTILLYNSIQWGTGEHYYNAEV
jgi:hypothetical protein